MPSVTRRAVLLGGTAMGVSAVSAPGVAAAAAPAAMPADRLALNYRPSQLTGWPPTYRGPGAPTVGATLGGHQTVRDFTFDATAYRIALLLPDPCYEVLPTDPTVAFRDTLAAA